MVPILTSRTSTPQTCYILGLGGCRARDDHAAPRLAGETCSILANQPQLGLAAADPPESGFVGSVGLGLQYVRVSRADEMRGGVRGRRTEGRFSADRPVHESPQDAREYYSGQRCNFTSTLRHFDTPAELFRFIVILSGQIVRFIGMLQINENVTVTK
mgnify:CR=1 FL=1